MRPYSVVPRTITESKIVKQQQQKLRAQTDASRKLFTRNSSPASTAAQPILSHPARRDSMIVSNQLALTGGGHRRGTWYCIQPARTQVMVTDEVHGIVSNQLALTGGGHRRGTWHWIQPARAHRWWTVVAGAQRLGDVGGNQRVEWVTCGCVDECVGGGGGQQEPALALSCTSPKLCEGGWLGGVGVNLAPDETVILVTSPLHHYQYRSSPRSIWSSARFPLTTSGCGDAPIESGRKPRAVESPEQRKKTRSHAGG